MSVAPVSVAGLVFGLLACVLAAGQESDTLEQLDEASFAEVPVLEQMTKIINGIPMHLSELENTPEAAALLQGNSINGDVYKKWIFVFNFTDHQKIHELNKSLAAAGLHDEWEGEIMNDIIVNATEAKVRQFMSSIDTASGLFKDVFIQQDGTVAALPLSSSVVAEEEEEGSAVPWGLDRIDDRTGLDNDYSSFPSSAGAGVNVYVLDTGIRYSHQDFEGRALPAWDAFKSGGMGACSPEDTNCAYDRQSHGTHCAGTVAGKRSGVAKKATVFSVKVLSDQGYGSFTGIIAGMDWVVAHGKKPAIMSMSLGGSGKSPAVDKAVEVAHNAGIPVVVAAGNGNRDACTFLPANAPLAFTVGSTGKDKAPIDQRSKFSNYGKCLDIYAPGHSISSTSHRSDTAWTTMSGTSMACPHVAGAVALVFGQSLGKQMSAADAQAAIVNAATVGAVTDAKPDSPNKLLYTSFSTSTTTTRSAPTRDGITSNLLDLIVSMIKMTRTLSDDHKGVLADMKVKLINKELPALSASLSEDQNLLNYHAKVLGDCDLGFASRSSAVKKLEETSIVLGQAAAECAKLRNGLLKQKHSASDEFKAWLTSAQLSAPSDQLPSQTCSDDLEQWIAAGTKFYEDFNETYTEYKINETKLDVEAKLSVVNCSSEEKLHSQALCSWKMEIGSAVTAYKSCRNETSLLYNSTLQRFKTAESLRHSKHKELLRSHCQLTALCLPGPKVDFGALDACDQTSADSNLTLKEPMLVPYNTKAVDALGGPPADTVCS